MCLVKKPKPVVVSKASDKPLPILRNPFLDGIDPILRARQTGVRSLRIDRGTSPAPTPSALAVTRPATVAPAPTGPTADYDALSRLPGNIGRTFARAAQAQR